MIKENKNITQVDSIRLSEYILFKGGGMSHLKLQKILYYAQAYHLAYFDKPVIDDDFEAWVHGPVSRKLYNEIKDLSILYNEVQYKGEESQLNPDEYLKGELTTEQIELIDNVVEGLKDLSGLQLENMTHSEDPWIQARKGYAISEKCNEIIPKETMKNYYKQQIYG